MIKLAVGALLVVLVLIGIVLLVAYVRGLRAFTQRRG